MRWLFLQTSRPSAYLTQSLSPCLSTIKWTVVVLVVLLTKFEAECLLLMNVASSLASGGKIGEEPWSSRRVLGDGNLRVSPAGVGCLNFGLDVNEEEGHRMLDLAVDEYGVNLIDTSEEYPFPMSPDRFGAADEIVGSWLKGRDRSKLIIATKVAGQSNFINWMREDGSMTEVNVKQIRESVERSLMRLGTDYIDLLQIAWPDRYVGNVGEYFYDYDKAKMFPGSAFDGQLMALQELMNEGKVREIGVCDETPYGLMKFCEHSNWDKLPKIVSTQQPYNLLSRNHVELGLVETCSPSNCNISILAHTPLAGGVLTGKYIGKVPAEAASFDRNIRLNKYPGWLSRYQNSYAQDAVKEYNRIAMKHNMPLTEIALRWVGSNSYIACTMLGATKEGQLRQNLEAIKKGPLSNDVLEELYENVYVHFREPTFGPSVV